MKKLLIAGLFGLTQLLATAQVAAQSTKIIYGDDNRYDTANYPDREFREYAKAVAGMVKSSKLTTPMGDVSVYTFRKRTLEESMNVCSNERFSQQYTLPICTGFLVDKDVLVTAGHCITNQFDCQQYSWVFDYNAGDNSVKKDNVYKCDKIIEQELIYKWFKLRDYAVVKLDRPVEGRTPLKFRKRGRPLVGTDLVVIGHPSGLPQKIADGASVKFANWSELLTPVRSTIRHSSYFIANLDTYAGNSGSPVINKKKGYVEGILIQGATDYRTNSDGFCSESNRRSNSALVSQEKVYRITKVPYVKKMIKALKHNQKREPDDTDE